MNKLQQTKMQTQAEKYFELYARSGKASISLDCLHKAYLPLESMLIFRHWKV